MENSSFQNKISGKYWISLYCASLLIEKRECTFYGKRLAVSEGLDDGREINVCFPTLSSCYGTLGIFGLATKIDRSSDKAIFVEIGDGERRDYSVCFSPCMNARNRFVTIIHWHLFLSFSFQVDITRSRSATFSTTDITSSENSAGVTSPPFGCAGTWRECSPKLRPRPLF